MKPIHLVASGHLSPFNTSAYFLRFGDNETRQYMARMGKKGEVWSLLFINYHKANDGGWMASLRGDLDLRKGHVVFTSK